MNTNFKNTMVLSEEAVNEVVTSEDGLYWINEHDYSKSMLLAKNTTDLLDEYNTYKTLAEHAALTRVCFKAFDNSPFTDMRESAEILANSMDEAVVLQKKQLGDSVEAHENLAKEVIKMEAKSSLITAIEYANTDEDYTDCAIAVKDFNSEQDMEFMLDVLDEIISKSSSKSLASYIEQIRVSLRMIATARDISISRNNEQIAS